MSVRVMDAVFRRYPTGGGEMLLALALADVARDDGMLMFNDTVSELARKTRQSRRGVQLQLRRMQAMGWLHAVEASDGGRGAVSVYRIDRDWIEGAELAVPVSQEGGEADLLSPPSEGNNCEPSSQLPPPETANPATRNCEPRSHAYKEPNTTIKPPSPPLVACDRKERQVDGSEDGQGNGRTLKAWLAECKARGEQPVPEGDAVFGYAARVGIGRDIIELHWRVFKARRLASRKRQRAWRQVFRNSVEDNWFGLWWLPPGRPAELTSKGRQALAFHAAPEPSS